MSWTRIWGGVALVALCLWQTSASATSDCEGFRKQISVDGGMTWHDADDAASAPSQSVGAGAIYRFIVKNCFTNKRCENVTIEDPDLGINALVGDGVLVAQEEVIVTQLDPGFANLNQPDRCDTPGTKINTATETNTVVPSNPPLIETMQDTAYLICEELPAVSVGDRVWEDLDGNGEQNCVDGGAGDSANPADGVIGNAGDAGPECGAGVPDVTVELFEGPDCSIPAGPSTMTDADGFYLFENLNPGDYCVRFDPTTVPEDFCAADVNGMPVNLGAPTFTLQDAAGDAMDSDADPQSGLTASVAVPSGSNLTLDAGLVCPAKLGDQVFVDENKDGIQQPGEPGVPDVEVELIMCGPDGVAGTPDDIPVGEIRPTDATGMYMFGGEPGVYDLPPGDYFARFNPATFPPGFDITTPKVGGDDTVDSDCLPGGTSACVDLNDSRAVNMNRDCGLVPPPPPACDLLLDKTCRVEVPPPPAFDKCDGKLQQFTVAWTDGPIVVNGLGKTNLAVNSGDVVTFTGPFGQNDVVINLSGAQNGTSTFHMSCSDPDFNDPSDCGKAAGNGKGSSGINLWTLEGFVDSDGRVLNCGGNGDGPFAQSCSFERGPLPSCDTTGKPETLTWRYDGGGSAAGGCDGSTFSTAVNADGKLHKDFTCEGAADLGDAITVIDDDGGATLVNPGESFTLALDAVKELDLVQGGMTAQSLEFHTSCSQPIQAGLTAGSLTLEALDGLTGGANVTYQYEVTNNGDPLSNVSVSDDLLGEVGSVGSLGSGASATFTASSMLMDTTVNVATATGTLADGSMCSPASATDSVVVEATAPTCAVTAAFKELKDDAIKYTLTNTSSIVATLETLVLDFPGAHGVIKEVKLDGAIYKSDDSSLVVGPGVTIGATDWTKADVSKRQLDPGEKRTLEIKFTMKSKTSEPGDFAGNVTFQEGCASDL